MPNLTIPKIYTGVRATGGNPGLQYWRNVGVSNVLRTVYDGEGSIYGMTVRNPNLTACFINFYNGNASTVPQIGSAASAAVIIDRLQIPGALDASNPGQLIISPGYFPVYYFPSGITIAAITTDSDTGSSAPAAALYVMLQVA